MTAMKEATAPATDGAGAKGKGGKAKKPSFLKSKKGIIVLLVLVLGGGGGAYKFLLAPAPKPAPAVGGDTVPLDATTLNLQNGHYLKIAVAVQLVKGKATAADFNTSQAAELVLNEFSDRPVASISTNPARLALSKALDTQMKLAYPGEVFDVFITQFVTQ